MLSGSLGTENGIICGCGRRRRPRNAEGTDKQWSSSSVIKREADKSLPQANHLTECYTKSRAWRNSCNDVRYEQD